MCSHLFWSQLNQIRKKEDTRSSQKKKENLRENLSETEVKSQIKEKEEIANNLYVFHYVSVRKKFELLY